MDRRRFPYTAHLQKRRNFGLGACPLWQRHTGFHGIRRRRSQNTEGAPALQRAFAMRWSISARSIEELSTIESFVLSNF